MLEGKKILLGVTGSIAAYKSVVLLRLLKKEGAEVKVLMTPGATEFIAPLTFSTLSKGPVLTGIIDDNNWNNHVELGRWADVMIIAPATCNTLAKMATGICDNLLLAVYLSAKCPIIISPAMDEDMWLHPATKSNVAWLKQFGHQVLQVTHGELASGLIGEGRMAEPEDILKFVIDRKNASGRLQGKKALVTAGPTYEHLDPVRFIGNHSSGKMGIAIANALQREGALVTLITGPMYEPVNESFTRHNIISAEEMLNKTKELLTDNDIIVMAAAVADYRPATLAAEKIKKRDDKFSFDLVKTTDILQYIGDTKRNDQVVVGFALETTNGKENALSKLEKKKADMIVLNELAEGVGFGADSNQVTIFEKGGKEISFQKKRKDQVAVDIVNEIIKYRNENNIL